jgi:hypothetical protein
MAPRAVNAAAFAAGYLSSAKTASELHQRLETALSTLAAIEQAEDVAHLPPGLENLAAQLVQPTLLKSKSMVRPCDKLMAGVRAQSVWAPDRAAAANVGVRRQAGDTATRAFPGPVSARLQEARLLVGCCLVEVLRIYAPTPPYSTAEQKVRGPRLTAAATPSRGQPPARLRRRVLRPLPSLPQAALSLVTAQLAHLRQADGEEQAFERACYILESLATVRCCVILAEMANAPAEGGDDGDGSGGEDPEEPLITMFETLLDAIQCVVLREGGLCRLRGGGHGRGGSRDQGRRRPCAACPAYNCCCLSAAPPPPPSPLVLLPPGPPPASAWRSAWRR